MKTKEDIRVTIEKQVPGFAASVNNILDLDVKNMLASLSQDAADASDAKDAALDAARNAATALAAQHSTLITTINLKISYLLALIKDRAKQ